MRAESIGCYSITAPVFLDKGDRTDCRSFTFRQLDLHRNMMTPSHTYGARWFASPWFLNIYRSEISYSRNSLVR